MTRSVLLLALAVAVLGSCGAPLRPESELEQGAAAVVPWAALEFEAMVGVPKIWRLPLRNPVKAHVVLAPPRTVGCGNCVQAVWDPRTSMPDGSAALGPGETTWLFVRYTGEPAAEHQRYGIAFSLARSPQLELRMPLKFRFGRVLGFSKEDLSPHTTTGSVRPLSLSVPDPRSVRFVGGDLGGQADRVSFLVRPGKKAGDAATLLVVPHEPWRTYEAGTLRFRSVGSEGEWTTAWRVLGLPPFRARVLPGPQGAPSTVLIDSDVAHGASVELCLPTTDGEVRVVSRVEVGPGERLHVLAPAPAERAEVPGGRAAVPGERAEVVVRMRGYETEQRLLVTK